eukprot:6836387-Lingulodinium_polyedra.AAC.1
MCFSEEFGRKHPSLRAAFGKAIARACSKWQESSTEKGYTVLPNLRDNQAFLQQVRQFPRAGGVAA